MRGLASFSNGEAAPELTKKVDKRVDSDGNAVKMAPPCMRWAC